MGGISSGFRDVLTGGRVVLMDGAMGTALTAAGWDPAGGQRCSAWNHARPVEVARVHRAYAAAGAEVVLTNTFQFDPGDGSAARAVGLARSAAPSAWVLGDIGPRPDGRYAECAAELAGVDGYLVETLSPGDLDAALSLPGSTGLPVLVSFSLRHGEIGPELRELARRVTRAGFAALGVNCGREIDLPACAAALREYREGTDLPLFARPNAGTPTRTDAGWVYPRSPEGMAGGVGELIEAGACLIGGCCGTTPAHIAAMGRVIAGRRR